MPAYDSNLALCPVCGTQYDTPIDNPPDACRICEDPRQYVPAAGQTWTSLAQSQGKHSNTFTPDTHDSRIISITTSPKLGIGQRAILLRTPHGNVLWDCLAYLDAETVSTLASHGGVNAIVISHPHFYTSHLVWAEALQCSVYVHAGDKEYLCRADGSKRRKFIEADSEEVVRGVTAVRIGGHFEGQVCLLWEGHLCHSDGFVNVPAGFTPEPSRDRVKGMTSFAFMWSIPNMIPLGPEEVWGIWKALRRFEFECTHGLYLGWDVRAPDVKERLLESMKVHVRRMGWTEHKLLEERVEGGSD